MLHRVPHKVDHSKSSEHQMKNYSQSVSLTCRLRSEKEELSDIDDEGDYT